MTQKERRFSGLFSVKILIPTVILLTAAMGAYVMIKTAPKAHRVAPVTILPTVEVATYEKGSHAIGLSVMGTVVAANEVTLVSRLSGEIVSVSDSFLPGGFFRKGDEVLRIDPKDYELALRETKADMVTAEYDLKVEQGYQNVAGREWNLLKKSAKGTEQEAELALRKPHLLKAQADLEAAKAQVEQAEINLQRTKVTAPFASMIESKSSDIGATVAAQEALATIVGTDEFWVEVSVPVDRLDHITFPMADGTVGSKTTVYNGKDETSARREGHVIRLLPSLESEGRMARVLISIADPLNLKGDPSLKPILLGSYVKVVIAGGEIADSYAIPRKVFRDNSKIWVLGQDGTLDIRTVNPVWRDAQTILLKEGLMPGEQVVLSSLTAPMQGMKLQAASDTAVTVKTTVSVEAKNDLAAEVSHGE
ncbi:efflux RND transporter periplasmic adaptor subunit [Pseudodesulfovibrio piezophilus]|uniref:Efflux transporter, RND family, MFP subunit n=1 Tax=Pseudodesulfovibrio piezophilus (strain DSM 21447 / JCM 15486 / C1TLV30) TaxID=1322246 RepID=M1WN63_PSEP2|nr:efflux RND transporter periplasmic adaptor subunit [Pseudodesulfovibrio piezophilus]CCH50190.1 Efflux transporter, RND family, MFP subunit [Pseudodesulfovibrio piezophilus C1TLV30]